MRKWLRLTPMPTEAMELRPEEPQRTMGDVVELRPAWRAHPSQRRAYDPDDTDAS